MLWCGTLLPFVLAGFFKSFQLVLALKDIFTLRHQPSHCLTCFQKYLLLPCMYHSKSEANPIDVPTPSSNSRKLGRKQYDFSQHQKKKLGSNHQKKTPPPTKIQDFLRQGGVLLSEPCWILYPLAGKALVRHLEYAIGPWSLRGEVGAVSCC